jgi:hypothetical protein
MISKWDLYQLLHPCVANNIQVQQIVSPVADLEIVTPIFCPF